MKNLAFTVALVLAPGLAQADVTDVEKGFSLLEEGASLLLQGLLAEIEPKLQELETTLGQLQGYHPPEFLPNGDIIIRKRQSGEAIEPNPENEEIEL